MSSSIQFRFSSSKTYEAVTFSGLMIKLLELKRAIVEKRNLDKGTSDFDLRISNAQTDEVYESDDVMVPQTTSVVVRRVPGTAETGLLAKLEGPARVDMPAPPTSVANSPVAAVHGTRLTTTGVFFWTMTGYD